MSKHPHNVTRNDGVPGNHPKMGLNKQFSGHDFVVVPRFEALFFGFRETLKGDKKNLYSQHWEDPNIQFLKDHPSCASTNQPGRAINNHHGVEKTHPGTV